MLLLGLGFLFFLALSKGMGPFEMTFNYLEAQLKATIKIYEEMGFFEKRRSKTPHPDPDGSERARLERSIEQVEKNKSAIDEG